MAFGAPILLRVDREKVTLSERIREETEWTTRRHRTHPHLQSNQPQTQGDADRVGDEDMTYRCIVTLVPMQ